MSCQTLLNMKRHYMIFLFFHILNLSYLYQIILGMVHETKVFSIRQFLSDNRRSFSKSNLINDITKIHSRLPEDNFSDSDRH